MRRCAPPHSAGCAAARVPCPEGSSCLHGKAHQVSHACLDSLANLELQLRDAHLRKRASVHPQAAPLMRTQPTDYLLGPTAQQRASSLHISGKSSSAGQSKGVPGYSAPKDSLSMTWLVSNSVVWKGIRSCTCMLPCWKDLPGAMCTFPATCARPPLVCIRTADSASYYVGACNSQLELNNGAELAAYTHEHTLTVFCKTHGCSYLVELHSIAGSFASGM